MIGYIILVLAVVLLSAALYFRTQAAKKQSEDGQRLLTDYQKRVNELEKLLKDYRDLEQNFDSVGQGYEQALLTFDKLEEEKQQMQNTIKALQEQNEKLQQERQSISGPMLQKKEIVEKAALEAKKALRETPGNLTSVVRQLNTILNVNDVGAETAIEADDNVTVDTIIGQAVSESGIGQNSYLTFTNEVAEDVKQMMLLTSEQQVVRILSALLDNAQKFTTDGSVKLSGTIEGNSLKLTVEDTGTGIPAGDAEHVFEPFVKLNSYFDGDGVGLTAARSIARRLKGDLTLDGSYSGGARFVLTLPI